VCVSYSLMYFKLLRFIIGVDKYIVVNLIPLERL